MVQFLGQFKQLANKNYFSISLLELNHGGIPNSVDHARNMVLCYVLFSAASFEILNFFDTCLSQM